MAFLSLATGNWFKATSFISLGEEQERAAGDSRQASRTAHDTGQKNDQSLKCQQIVMGLQFFFLRRDARPTIQSKWGGLKAPVRQTETTAGVE